MLYCQPATSPCDAKPRPHLRRIVKFAPLALCALLTVALRAQPVRFAGETAAVDRQADALVARMTLAEKIGQMIQVDYKPISKRPEDITRLAIGSVLNGGDSDPGDNSPAAWAAAVNQLQQYALRTRLKIPLLYGVDAVHGDSNIPGAVIFPHNIGLGATRDPALVERAERITALEMRAVGPNWAFAPGVIVARDERWGRTYESFSEDPTLVGELGAAAVRGFQTDDLADSGAVLACAKHYLGDGGTTGGVNEGNTVCDDATMRRLFLAPYVHAVRAGVGSVMISYSSWNGLKMHANHYLITDVLKGELGFRGFTVSDWAAIDQLGPDYAQDIETSVNAGLDMVMIPWGPPTKNNYVEFARDLRKLVRDGRVSEARVTDAARRILRVKLAMHLSDRPFVNRALFNQLGSPAHRAVARECVQKSLVLLKNDRAALPLTPALHHIRVIGSAADDLGAQCGGWTISWQGGHGDVTKGTTLLAALREQAPPGCTISYDPTGEKPLRKVDATIVVVAEPPYAESKGDRKDLHLSPRQMALIRRAHAGKAPVILVLFSGRPMILGDALPLSDAIVAAWLPGTEGEGLADVLYGHVAPTGKLPMSWPRSMAQIPINVGDADYHPLFPYGYGLTYATTAAVR